MLCTRLQNILMRDEPAGTRPHLVLLHGWGMHARVWAELSVQLAPQFRVLTMELPAARTSPDALDSIAYTLAAASPSRVIVGGWSLGGQVALRWAQLRPAQVERLILFSTTPRFVNGSDWTHGMAPAVFDAFAESLEQDVNATLQRFVLLQAHRDKDVRHVARRLSECMASGQQHAPALANGLRLLKVNDLRPELTALTQRVLILHGDRDTVVPLCAGEFLHQSLQQAEIKVIAGDAHAPFITAPQTVAHHIAEFGHG